MDVYCEDCGRCCFSPIFPDLLGHVADPLTRQLLVGVIEKLIHLRIIRKDKPVRSGMIFREELVKIINEGLIAALAPNNLLVHPERKLKALSFRLRHVVVPMSHEELEFDLPVFACVFFDPGSHQCIVHDKEYYPLLCKLFPYDETYKFERLKNEGKIDRGKRLLPICGAERLNGELTEEQREMVKASDPRLQAPPPPAQIQDLRDWKHELRKVPFSFIPLAEYDCMRLGISSDNSSASTVSDLDQNLPELIRRPLEREFRTIKIDPPLDDAQKEIKDRIISHLTDAYTWWHHYTITPEIIRDLSKEMVDLFIYRMILYRT